MNHPDNLIPLCADCHTRFDKPRTRQEYERVAEIKRRLIAASLQRAIQDSYPLETDIARVIERLYTVTFSNEGMPVLDPHAKDVDDKFDSTLPVPTRRKIKHAIADYYIHVKQGFREIELQTPSASTLIFSQVHAFYLKQKSLGLPQSEIFSHVVDWISSTTAPETTEAAEIVASFFVQNCEVFE